MSGETVTSNALQFTNDNKHAYAYSGLIDAGATEDTLLLFNTQSEYVKAFFQFCYIDDQVTDDFQFKIYFNNTVVAGSYVASASDSLQKGWFKLIIPPFTIVKGTVKNKAGASNREIALTVTGKVGMPQRVGNLDE